MYYTYHESPIGKIIIAGDENGVAHINFADYFAPDEDWLADDKYFEDVCHQLDEYFMQERKEFSFKTQMLATSFQKDVYNIINQIPYGELESYTSIAEKLGDKNKVRAVANACGQNKNLIVVPCHRVVRKDGNMCGYSAGTNRKKYLMSLEK